MAKRGRRSPRGRFLAVFALLAALGAYACSRSKPLEDFPDNGASTQPKPTPPAKKKQPPPAAEKPKAAKLPEAPPIPSDQQMLDDADATGLTATLPTDDDAGSAEASNGQ